LCGWRRDEAGRGARLRGWRRGEAVRLVEGRGREGAPVLRQSSLRCGTARGTPSRSRPVRFPSGLAPLGVLAVGTLRFGKGARKLSVMLLF